MSFKNMMISLLIDCYEYSSQLNGASEDEIDEILFDENAEVLEDEEIFYSKSNILLTDDNYKSIYMHLLDVKNNEFSVFKETFGECNNIFLKKHRQINYVLPLLIYRYILYNYSDNDKRAIIEYFSQLSESNLISLFFNNLGLGVDLIKNYYNSILENDVCDLNLELIIKDGNELLIKKWEEKISDDFKFVTLNDLLRELVCKLFNHYISTGCTTSVALDYVWAFFEYNLNPISFLQEMGFNEREIRIYKDYLKKLIIADLYEDCNNEPLILDDSVLERKAALMPILFAKMEKGLSECEARNNMLYHFILLQEDKAKMIRNRTKTIDDGNISVLKKVNPLYYLDNIF